MDKCICVNKIGKLLINEEKLLNHWILILRQIKENDIVLWIDILDQADHTELINKLL